MSFDPHKNDDDYREMITCDPWVITLERARQILPHAELRLLNITHYDEDCLGKTEGEILSKIVDGLKNRLLVM